MLRTPEQSRLGQEVSRLHAELVRDPGAGKVGSGPGCRYTADVLYAGAVDFSLYTAGDGDVYRIDDLLIANRYHDTNLSRTVHSSCYLEMRRIAEKHGIELSPAERLRMHLNRSWVSLQKAAFLLWVRVRGRFGAPG